MYLRRATNITEKTKNDSSPSFDEFPSIQRKNQLKSTPPPTQRIFSLLEPDSDIQYTILSGKRSITHSFTSTSFTIPFTKFPLQASITRTTLRIPSFPKVPHSINNISFNIPSTPPISIPLSSHTTILFTIPFTKHKPKYNTSSIQQFTLEGTTRIPWNETSSISASTTVAFFPSSFPKTSPSTSTNISFTIFSSPIHNNTLLSPTTLTSSTSLDLSKLIPLYLSPIYLSFPHRTIFPLILPSQFISSFISALSSTLPLPITFYEPITTVQKPCEKFINAAFLHKAFITNSSLTSFPETLLHLSTFALSEMTLNLKRFLFPMPSSQNETFSYFNTTYHYFYFAEHSHNTTIYTAQSNIFSFYSTYATEHSYNCRMNAIEYKDSAVRFINFNAQTDVWFSYTLPTLYMKHVLLGKANFVYEGDVVIKNNINNARCEIAFAKGNNGEYKGKIMNEKNEIVYEIEGVLGKCMDVVDNNKAKRRILDEKVYKGEMYLRNKIGKFHDYNYYLPLLNYEFNNGRDVLKHHKLIFNSDTRNRQDIISYEEGDIPKAQEAFEQHQQQHTINSNINVDINETKYFIKTTPSLLAVPVYQLKPSFVSELFPL